MKNSMILYGKYVGYKSVFDLINEDNLYPAVCKIVSAAEKYSLSGDVFKAYLALLIINDENAFSIACEKRDIPKCSIYSVAMNDIKVLRSLFNAENKNDYLAQCI